MLVSPLKDFQYSVRASWPEGGVSSCRTGPAGPEGSGTWWRPHFFNTMQPQHLPPSGQSHNYSKFLLKYRENLLMKLNWLSLTRTTSSYIWFLGVPAASSGSAARVRGSCWTVSFRTFWLRKAASGKAAANTHSSAHKTTIWYRPTFRWHCTWVL